MAEPQERLLFEHLGEPCLAYLMNVTREQLTARLEGGEGDSPLNQVQLDILRQLAAIDAAYFSAQEPIFANSNWMRHLTSRADGAVESGGNAMRRIAGGSIATPESSLSGVRLTLAQLAIDVYPGLLIREDESPFRRIGYPLSLHGNPLNEQFQEQVLQDDSLKRLYPTDSESSGPSGNALRSSGSGGSIQVWTFAESLLAAGWRLACLDVVSPSVSQFVGRAIECLDAVRSAVEDKSAQVEVRVGLTGVLLPEGLDTVELGSVSVRRADERDQYFVKMTGLEGQLTGTDEHGQSAIINYAGDLVMETKIPYLIDIHDDPTGMVGFSPGLLEGFNHIEEAAQSLRLGLLLAHPDMRPTLLPTWRAILDPLSAGFNTGWSDARQNVGLMPRQLTDDQVAAWKEWADLIHELRTPSVSVAISRMLAAVAERRRPDDVLVDAVIVWENLFGAKTETTLRVTSSLAWLLGTSEVDRRKRQTEYKRIYAYRSAVVHGAPGTDIEKMNTFSQAAVGISIEALRAVFERRPELLDEKSSEDRSLRIMHAGEKVDED